ncbi:hypothetical protein D1815_18090 [Aquimarina sp. AD1]|nr:hypothetical protein [Aquimarina latercula]AXT57564.1 hypothetical protein D1815_18090 [Aquimarina sp. AD1]RKN34270.1 hypothetical protein D7035_04465 [Aquimarina sp. AD1]
MTVEIIKKYKGNEQRKKIKILGDNGMLCRPYLSNFKINSYYLVSPNALDNSANTEYDFFSCRTEYLNVDIDSNVALGNYSLIRNQINLDKFENKVKNGDWDILLLSLILSSIILLLLFMRRNIKRKTNRSSD